jgi:GNAT superfamily N-acetyltransferase
VSSRVDDLSYRRATVADAPQVAELAAEGFATYGAFAPPGWSGPTLARELEFTQAVLSRPSAWCLLAEEGSRLRGHVAFLAAADSRVPTPDPALAHLWQLFAAQAWWGSGLAARLLASAVDVAGRHGFERMRLWTPAGHARARRFYEREGWTAPGEPVEDPVFGMATIEYVRDLG